MPGRSLKCRVRRTICQVGLGGVAVTSLSAAARGASGARAEDSTFVSVGRSVPAPSRPQEATPARIAGPSAKAGAGQGQSAASGVQAAAAAASLGLLAQAVSSRTGRQGGPTRRHAQPEGKDSASRQRAAAGASGRSGREPGAARGAVAGDVQLVTDVSPDAGPEGTYQVGIDFKNWLQSAREEIQEEGLRVEGSLPPWLRGSLMHAGPAKFEFGDDEFVDWVDGQAMLYRLQISGEGECSYRNRWLDTWNHRSHREAGRIAVRETCSRPSIDNIWDRFFAMFSPPNNENGNLHISQVCGNTRCISMSVGSSLLEFNLSDMSTVGKLPFDDELVEGGPLIFHAEPHLDPVTGEWFTCAIQLKISPEDMGLKPEYVVFSVEASQSQEPGATVQRRLITRIQTETPSPVHTISLTEKYIVMIQIPYPLNWDGMMNAEGKWLLTGKYEGNLNDYNIWQPERSTLIRLIDRETGEHTAVFETDAFFFFHTINAFEEKDGENDVVYLDVVCYDEAPVGFPLQQARHGDVNDWRGGGGEVRRFKLDLTTGETTCTGWPDNCFDEPKINPKVDGARHRYSYGVIDDHGMLRLTKQDHDTHEVFKWEEQDISRELPWQPVFVPEPYSESEDAGVLLSFVRDQPTGNNFCVVIDTETFKERARIHLPEGHHIPLHGHGTWMQGQF